MTDGPQSALRGMIGDRRPGARDGARAEMSAAYEYIVVGSGPGGAPVAANLARAGHAVLLLEAGGMPTGEDYDYEVPAFHTRASEEDSLSGKFFVRHYTDEERQPRDTKDG